MRPLDPRKEETRKMAQKMFNLEKIRRSDSSASENNAQN
jgi:hypothetical protein